MAKQTTKWEDDERWTCVVERFWITTDLKEKCVFFALAECVEYFYTENKDAETVKIANQVANDLIKVINGSTTNMVAEGKRLAAAYSQLNNTKFFYGGSLRYLSGMPE